MVRSRLLLALAFLLALAGCIQPQDAPGDDAARDAPRNDDASTTACAQTMTATGGGGGSQSGVSNQRGSFSYAKHGNPPV